MHSDCFILGVFELHDNKASHNTVPSMVVKNEDQGVYGQPRQGHHGEVSGDF
jgi:hypothetical protein